MACQITMFSNLGGTPDNGGTWVYNGVGTVDFIVDAVQATYAPAAQIGTLNGGETTTLDVSPTPNGTYTFTYSAGLVPCIASAILTIIVNEGAIAGVDYTVTVCNSDSQAYNLMDILAGGDGTGAQTGTVNQTGTFTGGGTASSGYTPGSGTPEDDTFTPNIAGVVLGNNVFFYDVDTSGGGTPGCDNCTDQATITFNVTDAADAGIDNTITLCNSI